MKEAIRDHLANCEASNRTSDHDSVAGRRFRMSLYNVYRTAQVPFSQNVVLIVSNTSLPSYVSVRGRWTSVSSRVNTKKPRNNNRKITHTLYEVRSDQERGTHWVSLIGRSSDIM